VEYKEYSINFIPSLMGRLPVISLLCPSDIIAFSFRRGRSEMDRITMNPNGTSHQTQICLEGPVSTRLESTLNLAILIAIDAIGDDHIFFIQARNLAGDDHIFFIQARNLAGPRDSRKDDVPPRYGRIT